MNDTITLSEGVDKFRYLQVVVSANDIKTRGSLIVPVGIADSGFVVPCVYDGFKTVSFSYVNNTTFTVALSVAQLNGINIYGVDRC